MNQQVEHYKTQGFREITTDSGTGSTILVSDKRRRAVKFNFDPAYDQFVSIVQSHSLKAFPKIYTHTQGIIQPGSIAELRYTITEMEFLDPLTIEEQTGVVSWIDKIYNARRAGVPLEAIKDDPFGLMEGVAILMSFAAKNAVHLDLGKGTNYMIRVGCESRDFVITDPFNE